MQGYSYENLKKMANAVRILSVDMVEKAKSGHPGMPLGAADIVTVLFAKFLKFNSKDSKWFDRDRFVLSAGHASAMLYSLLYLTGYEDVSIDDLRHFRQFGSKTAGHPEYGFLAGIEATTGPLGQGFGNAVGMAIAQKSFNARFGGNDISNHKIYCMVGDGCLMEGISYEVASIAGHLGLSKLILLWDNNSYSIDGNVSLTRSENMKMRFESVGWKYIFADGHDYKSIENALSDSQNSDKPVIIDFKTIIGYGSIKANSEKSHGSPLGEEGVKKLREVLNWNFSAFSIPEEILKSWREVSLRNESSYKKWQENFDSSQYKNDITRISNYQLPNNFLEECEKAKTQLFLDKPKEATRKSSERIIDLIAKFLPEAIIGSADLSESNCTKTKSLSEAITKDDFSGQYIHYGIREHGMAAIMNGLTLSGLLPIAGTFLAFSDYMKPAIRLAALSKLRSIFIFTHDSIGLGEDGPTHQPVEHLAMLRSIPNLNVFRPADSCETISCFEIALNSPQTPSAIILTRQAVPFVRNIINSKHHYSAHGGYVISESVTEPDVVILATGSEVSIALDTKEELHNFGIAVRIVSIPCLEIFEKQDQEYKHKIFGTESLIVRVAIEAGSRMCWDRFLREDDLFFGVDEFGFSAPFETIYDHFGITPEKMSQKILKVIKNKRAKIGEKIKI